MSWFFRITGAVFALFAVLVAVGAFLPGVQVVERGLFIDAGAMDAFEAIDDLTTYADWSHVGPAADDAAAFGPSTGVGATAAWDGAGQPGSLQIVQSSAPDLVLVAAQSGEDSAMITYALQEDADGTLLLIKQERELGGFPFFGRIEAKLSEGALARDMEASVKRLEAALSDTG